MSSFPVPEFDMFLGDFITPIARTVFAASSPSQDHNGEETETLVFFRAFSNGPEFDIFLGDFITSFARTDFAASSPSQDHKEVEIEILEFSNGPGNLVKDGALPVSKTAMEVALPVSKTAMEVMPTVTVMEEEDCVICLTEYGVAGEAKEMPCKHRYHSDCITKWLSIHGSCPVCRYEIPIDEEENWRRDGGVGSQVMITTTNQTRIGDQGRNSSDSIESNGSSTEDMDIDNGDWNNNSMDIDRW